MDRHLFGPGDSATGRHTHTHSDGWVGAENRECQSFTVMQALFRHSKSFPVPWRSACIGVAGVGARGRGRRQEAKAVVLIPIFPASLAFTKDVRLFAITRSCRASQASMSTPASQACSQPLASSVAVRQWSRRTDDTHKSRSGALRRLDQDGQGPEAGAVDAALAVGARTT